MRRLLFIIAIAGCSPSEPAARNADTVSIGVAPPTTASAIPSAQPAAAAREADIPCHQLLRGIGVAKDPARARACYERAVAAEPACGDNSPSIDRLQLALMRARGIGGPADSALPLLQACFADASAEEVTKVIQTGKGVPDSGDFCDGLAVTTLHVNACFARERADIEVKAAAVERRIEAAHGKAGVDAFRAARAAWDKLATADASHVSDIYRGGSLSSTTFVSIESSRKRTRLDRIASILDGTKPTWPKSAEASRHLAEARPKWRAFGHDDAASHKLFDEADRAFKQSRAEEAQLLVLLTGASRVEAEALLDETRVGELADLQQ
ncbi:MAG: hypothetical protein HOW73_44605 [Polyangiaceae bacterium]|nr:hypothetical protein [Polyangiaceae bacterium]